MSKMKLILTLIITFSSFGASASELCFVAKEKDQVVKQEGKCGERYAPGSTFKIPLAVMGFDSGILIDNHYPLWSHKPEYKLWISTHKGNHTPGTWMLNSVVWYSQELTTKLGMPQFQSYLDKFGYGNKDASGGLTECWLSSSLKISPIEQTEFLQRFIDKKLDVTDSAYAKTKEIIYIMEMAGNWKLYGKTGTSSLPNGNNHGWFVGFIEKDGRYITFATHLIDDKKEQTYTSFRARNEALIKLWYIINELEK